MAQKVQFLGFKRVSQSVFNSVTAEKKEQYLWFVKPDGDLVNESGDIYLGSYHYGHYGHADADNIKELWETLGNMFSSESGHTVSDVVASIQESLGDGFVDESGNTVTFTDAIKFNTDYIEAVDNEWKRVVGNGFVDGAVEVDGEKFFASETVSNVVCANTIALLIEVDEPINVSQEDLDDMVDNNSVASGLSTLLGDYSDVTLPEGEGDVDLENNIVVGGTKN